MVKISDVAQDAGVSPSTVSYVLSGKRRISEATRRRVLASIEALGYRPHAGARALASSRSNVVALVLPLHAGIHVPIVMQIATAIVTSARSFDHDVLLLTQDEGVAGLHRVAGSAMVDAIIVMDVSAQDARLPVLRALSHPSVLIGVPADTSGLACVDFDFAGAARSAVAHLARLGHREVALIGPPPEVFARGTAFAPRTVSGFQEGVRAAGLSGVVRSCDPAPEEVRALVTGLLAERPGLTGMVVHNESAVAPLLDALGTAGRRVPDDISVLAICPDELAGRMRPSLTSVNIPADGIGTLAVNLLMDKLNDRPVPETTLLEPHVTQRVSTAPVAAPDLA